MKEVPKKCRKICFRLNIHGHWGWFVFYSSLHFLANCGSGITHPHKSDKNGIFADREIEVSNSITQVKKDKVSRFNYLDLGQIQTIDIKKVFGNYLGQDAVWIHGHPIVINHEYDFELSMSIPGVGSGLAAQKRQEANQKLAQHLVTMPPANLKDVFENAIQDYKTTSNERRELTIALYGFLFINDEARLQTVLEVKIPQKEGDQISPDDKTILRIIYVSDSRTATGRNSWTDGFILVDELKKGVEVLGHLYTEFVSWKPTKLQSEDFGESEMRCPIGGNQKVSGRLVAEREEKAILLLNEDPITLIFCNSWSLSE